MELKFGDGALSVVDAICTILLSLVSGNVWMSATFCNRPLGFFRDLNRFSQNLNFKNPKRFPPQAHLLSLLLVTCNIRCRGTNVAHQHKPSPAPVVKSCLTFTK